MVGQSPCGSQGMLSRAGLSEETGVWRKSKIQTWCGRACRWREVPVWGPRGDGGLSELKDSAQTSSRGDPLPRPRLLFLVLPQPMQHGQSTPGPGAALERLWHRGPGSGPGLPSPRPSQPFDLGQGSEPHSSSHCRTAVRTVSTSWGWCEV